MRIKESKQKNRSFKTTESKKNRANFEGKSDKILDCVQKKSGQVECKRENEEKKKSVYTKESDVRVVFLAKR